MIATGLKWSIAVLLYGDHYDLHRRCLNSVVSAINDAPGLATLRVGYNQASAAGIIKLKELLEPLDLAVERKLYIHADNLLKYPVMREMLYDSDWPVLTPNVMWFDDDSYVLRTQGWLRQVTDKFEDIDYMGSRYFVHLSPQRKRWLQKQGWSNTKPVANPATFATGGWWCLKTERMKEVDYPFQAVPPGGTPLKHRGGDVALGVCAFQKGWRYVNDSCGVAINSDDFGKESKAPRRGFSSNISWGDDYRG